MKQLIIVALLIVAISPALAQTKPVAPVKPVVDTVRHLTPNDVYIRLFTLQQSAAALSSPDDYSVNQRKRLSFMADSLAKKDAAWFNDTRRRYAESLIPPAPAPDKNKPVKP